MNFPQFFRTAINQAHIASAKWRGLALLCKPSSTFRSIRGGSLEDQVMAATGTEYADRDVALHVSSKPNSYMNLASVTDGVTILAAKPGVRYFIHSFIMSSTMLVTDTGTSYGFNFNVGGTNRNIIIRNTTLLAIAQNMTGVLDILCDVNSAVSMTISGTYTAGYVGVSYSEVGAS